ncbi:hypothetical protein PR202_gb10939 [Eleusine coracana subsp. coracana]|uniref:UspA domain-containing protein n=1 Tax=Eleusine coracana subsp. coracana TaxID=191504 RepID=A0AAV5ELR5_ELECO|nr:hypothetical protein PR202_gb10939 [Eleusine coracana subsp. coracana]
MDETAASRGTLLGAGGAAGEQAAERKPRGLKVVVAVDASEESLHALSWAVDNVVRPNPTAALLIIHAQQDAEHLAYPLAAQGTKRSTTVPSRNARRY